MQQQPDLYEVSLPSKVNTRILPVGSDKDYTPILCVSISVPLLYALAVCTLRPSSHNKPYDRKVRPNVPTSYTFSEDDALVRGAIDVTRRVLRTSVLSSKERRQEERSSR